MVGHACTKRFIVWSMYLFELNEKKRLHLIDMFVRHPL